MRCGVTVDNMEVGAAVLHDIAKSLTYSMLEIKSTLEGGQNVSKGLSVPSCVVLLFKKQDLLEKGGVLQFI